MTEAAGTLAGHNRKLIFAKWHPAADYTIASAGIDTTVRIWDVAQQKCAITFEGLKHQANDIAWSHNGSLLATTTKDKLVSFFDPRQSSTFGSIQAHEGARQHKLVWLGDSQHILTCGYSALSEREFAIWDNRNFSAPLQKRQLDSYNGVPFTYFDEEHKVVFVAGKGDSAITYFQYAPSSPQMLEIQGAYKSKEP